MNPIALRLLNQHLTNQQFSKPEEVVSHFGAMQAQDYRMISWSVTMRTKNPSLKSFCDAFDKGEIVRLHLLRGTWQLVTGSNYHWMRELFASKAQRVIDGWMHANRINIEQKEYDQIGAILAQTASDLGSATNEDFEQALAKQGLFMDNHRLSYHIRHAEISGLLCSGNFTPKKNSYSLTSQKLPHNNNIDKDEALACIARLYFQSHAPATLEDFIWWTGLSKSECQLGIKLLNNELHTDHFKEHTFYLHESCRIRGFRKGHPILLPSYDEYLIGYKTRQIALSPEHQAKAHSNNGIFYPVILLDGEVCGNWSFANKRIQTTLFDANTPIEGLEKEIQRASKVLITRQ